MPIQCAVCGETFDQIIGYTHLKKHKLSVKKYQELYGSNTAEGFNWSEFIKSKNQHRKGIKLSTEHRNKLVQSFQSREEKYRSGKLVRVSHAMSEENRQLQKERMIEFAKQHPDIVSERVKKAQATRKNRGPGNRLGSKLDDETKQQIKQSLLIKGEQRQQQTLDKYRELINDQNIKIINRESTTVFFECETCNTKFTRSLQLLQPNKFQSELCSVCFPKIQGPSSKAEDEIIEFLKQLGVEHIVTRCRDIVPPRELDIYLPEYHLAIEYCGIYWHSELSGNKGQYYHQEKWRKCQEQHIQLLTIFDDEWRAKSSLIKAMIRNKIKKNSQNKIFARQCQIAVVDNKTSADFLNQNHIHGAAAAQVHLGLYHDNQLVYVMTFTKNNISRGNTQTWEIQRMAGSADIQVVGAASKLFSYFIKNYDPSKIISYADMRWFTGDSYQHMGFKFSSTSKPGYWYIGKNYTERKHRYSLRKNKSDDPALTEWQNRQAQGWDRIWDCGHAKWIWQKENGQD